MKLNQTDIEIANARANHWKATHHSACAFCGAVIFAEDGDTFKASRDHIIYDCKEHPLRKAEEIIEAAKAYREVRRIKCLSCRRRNKGKCNCGAPEFDAMLEQVGIKLSTKLTEVYGR